ncbi:MAG TPA: HAD family hydrolase [Rhodanobacter sp.]|jgi:FMN phosphatase YigB (HAD superfamily)|nr:HAD family hydrolase [Rhodanobacter sp.]
MSEAAELVFLLDVDNTLLDNDRFAEDLGDTLAQAFGAAERDRYWRLYEQLRDESGYADYLGALQPFRIGLGNERALLQMSEYLLEYPFAERLYPHALETIAHLRTLAPTVILSDGDVVYQPRKLQLSGIWSAVDGEVLIYVHKQRMLVAMQQRYPAAHYVMVDDKPHLLAAMKQQLGAQLITVFVRQGHYAAASESESIVPAPDLTIACIDELRGRKLEDFLPRASVIPLAAD